MTTQPYRPSNSTEGAIFEAKFCDKCAEMECWRKHGRDSCEIASRSMIYSIGDKEYPSEWIRDAQGPRCTAFRPEGSGTAKQYAHDKARYEAAIAEMRNQTDDQG